MSDPKDVSLPIPAYDQSQTLRDWHVVFARQNVESLRNLQAMAPGRIVLVTIDPHEPRAKVSFRTEHNVAVWLPPEEALRIGPEKILILTFNGDSLPVATRFTIDRE